jgi:hypothetical protein
MQVTRDPQPQSCQRLYRNFVRVVVPWPHEAESESICRSALKAGCSRIVRILHPIRQPIAETARQRSEQSYFLEKLTDAR